MANMERRKEPRFGVGGRCVLKNAEGDQNYDAKIVNISTGGLLLETLVPHPFKVGDEVSCRIAVPEDAERPFASWGLGRVVRVDERKTAVELMAATFTPGEQ